MLEHPNSSTCTSVELQTQWFTQGRISNSFSPTHTLIFWERETSSRLKLLHDLDSRFTKPKLRSWIQFSDCWTYFTATEIGDKNSATWLSIRMWLHTSRLEILCGFWRLSFPTWLWNLSISTVWSWFEPWQKSCEVILPNCIPDLYMWGSLYPKSSPAKCGSTLHLTCDATCNYLVTNIHEGFPELTKSIKHGRIYLQSGNKNSYPWLSLIDTKCRTTSRKTIQKHLVKIHRPLTHRKAVRIILTTICVESRMPEPRGKLKLRNKIDPA